MRILSCGYGQEQCEFRSEGQHVEELDEEIRWFEVERAVRQLEGGKASGEDEVIAELLKGANQECIRALWQVFGKCFEQEEISEEWTRGLIVPIPKNAEVRKGELSRYHAVEHIRQDLCRCSEREAEEVDGEFKGERGGTSGLPRRVLAGGPSVRALGNHSKAKEEPLPDFLCFPFF